MSEFNLIEKYFTWDSPPGSVDVAIGDDAAVLNISKGKQLVTSIDTLISGVHFPQKTPPDLIGYKALAVNLSDLAAMGATPHWFTLALTIPEIDGGWLNRFSKGMKALAEEHNCFLIGGDTTRGPLSISIQVMGFVDEGKSVLRSGAKVGDKLYVTGSLGDGIAGLQSIKGDLKLSVPHSNYCQQRLNKPTPRLKESEIIKLFASSCIDVSDGLLQDLSHMLKASHVGAEINLSELPLSRALLELELDLARQFAMAGGDDYELLFTIPANKESEFLSEIATKVSCKITCIGEITNREQIINDENGNLLISTGYNHFND